MELKALCISLITALMLVYTPSIYPDSENSIQSKNNPARSKACKECHEEIFNHWKIAQHSQSLEDPTFKLAFYDLYFKTQGKAKFNCLRCHAPIVMINNDYDLTNELTREGVTCNFCHSIKSIDLNNQAVPFEFETGETKWGPLKDVDSSAHQSGYSQFFESSELCAGCHEYTNAKGIKVLATYSEWKAGPYAAEGIQCQNCHMPLVEGANTNKEIKKSERKKINLHAIVAGHSVEQLKKALQLKIRKANKQDDLVEVIVEVTNSGSGHMIPTGIPTRKLILWVELASTSDTYSQKKEYERIMLDEEGKIIANINEIFDNSAKVSLDTRIKPRETRVERFVFTAPEGRRVRILARVEYQYKFNVLNPMEMRVKMAEDIKRLKE